MPEDRRHWNGDNFLPSATVFLERVDRDEVERAWIVQKQYASREGTSWSIDSSRFAPADGMLRTPIAYNVARRINDDIEACGRTQMAIRGPATPGWS